MERDLSALDVSQIRTDTVKNNVTGNQIFQQTNTGFNGGINSIESSSVPLVPSPSSIMHRYMRNGWFDPTSPIRLDITFNSATHRGEWTTSFSRKLLVQTPALPPLTLAIKLLLAGHGLNDAFSGGLSSFGV